LAIKSQIKILAQNSQTQRSRKQTHCMPSSYPLSAPFGLLIFVDDDTMAPTENVHCRSMIYIVS